MSLAEHIKRWAGRLTPSPPIDDSLATETISTLVAGSAVEDELKLPAPVLAVSRKRHRSPEVVSRPTRPARNGGKFHVSQKDVEAAVSSGILSLHTLVSPPKATPAAKKDSKTCWSPNTIVALKDSTNGGTEGTDTYRMIEFKGYFDPNRDTTCKGIQRKLRDVATAVLDHIHSDSELGSVDTYPQDSSLFMTLGASSKKGSLEVIAVVVARELQRAHRVVPPAAELSVPTLSSESSEDHLLAWFRDSSSVSDIQGNGCICGIQLVWVRGDRRGQSIASRMCDTVRRVLVYGYEFPRDHCAFSQPTLDGKRFAFHYSGRPDFLTFW